MVKNFHKKRKKIQKFSQISNYFEKNTEKIPDQTKKALFQRSYNQ